MIARCSRQCVGCRLPDRSGSRPGQHAGRSGDRAGDSERRRIPEGRTSESGRVDRTGPERHPLGMTALAGLALLENGMAREAREISKAREIVTIAGSRVGSDL